MAVVNIYLKNAESHINWNRRPLDTLDQNSRCKLSFNVRLGVVRMIYIGTDFGGRVVG